MEVVTEIKYDCLDLAQLPGIAEKILAVSSSKIFLFYGSMGAGKTTFIKELCKKLGVIDMVASPTFTIVNEYLSKTGSTIYHFDFYRIKSETEALDFGYEDYFYSGNYCFIEWPDKIASLLPEKAVRVFIETAGEKRIIKMHI